jgi:hypothetical protein
MKNYKFTPSQLTIYVGIVLIFGIVYLGTKFFLKQVVPSQQNWKTYSDEQYGFGFEYPSDIKVESELHLDRKRGVKYILVTLKVDKNIQKRLASCYSRFTLESGYLKVELTDEFILKKNFLNIPLKSEFIFPKPGEKSSYHQVLSIGCPSGISDYERFVISNSISYFSPKNENAISQLTQIPTIFSEFTLDTSNWNSYKNESGGVEFKYPSSSKVNLANGGWGFPGMNNVAEISIKNVFDVGFELGVGWVKYKSLEDQYTLYCGEGYDPCISGSYKEDVEMVVQHANTYISGYPARYWISDANWGGPHGGMKEYIIDIAFPNKLAEIGGIITS